MKNWFVLAGSLAVIFYSNCGQIASRSIASKIVTLKAEKSLTVATQNQILISYARCLNLRDEQLRPQTIATFNSVKSSFSSTGMAHSVTAPMMMSSISVTSEICLDLIDSENLKSDRFFLRGFNLGGPSTDAVPYDLEYTIQSFATSCWSRAATPQEIKIMSESLDSAGIKGQKSRAEALFICTNILASADAIKR